MGVVTLNHIVSSPDRRSSSIFYGKQMRTCLMKCSAISHLFISNLCSDKLMGAHKTSLTWRRTKKKKLPFPSRRYCWPIAPPLRHVGSHLKACPLEGQSGCQWPLYFSNKMVISFSAKASICCALNFSCFFTSLVTKKTAVAISSLMIPKQSAQRPETNEEKQDRITEGPRFNLSAICNWRLKILYA